MCVCKPITLNNLTIIAKLLFLLNAIVFKSSTINLKSGLKIISIKIYIFKK